MASLRYQAAHKFLGQHSGKSKQEILLEIAKIQNPDVIDDLLYYLVHGHLPREEKVKIRRLLGRNFYVPYCLYLYKDYRYLLFCDDESHQFPAYLDHIIDGYRQLSNRLKHEGLFQNLEPDENGIYVISFQGTHGRMKYVYDKSHDCLVICLLNQLPKVYVDLKKMNLNHLFRRDMCPIDVIDQLFEEDLFSPEVITWMEKKGIVSPRIELPREYLRNSVK